MTGDPHLEINDAGEEVAWRYPGGYQVKWDVWTSFYNLYNESGNFVGSYRTIEAAANAASYFHQMTTKPNTYGSW